MDKPYDGPEKLVMCLDVGTTMSAVSLIHLEPGSVPQIRSVDDWPCAPLTSKIPSVILYDSRGRAQLFGAEAIAATETSKTLKQARWFKLHLHPHSMEPPIYCLDPERTPERVFEVPKLPRGVTSAKAYEDFLKYLVRCTRSWVEGNYRDGQEMWERLVSSMVFVFAHPNGWETAQQAKIEEALRRATSQRSLDDRIIFVTEAEASVHFALHRSGELDWLKPGVQFAVADAGGSTVDIVVYEVERLFPKLQLKEVKNSECIQAGAIFPFRQARFLIDAKLKSSKYKVPQYLNRIMQEWEEKVKPNFTGLEDEDFRLRFGTDLEHDPKSGVVYGQLVLSAAEIAMAFSPSINLIIASIEKQLKETKVQHVLLTGGFGSSPYLQSRLHSTYSPRSIKIIPVPSDDPSIKPVSIGSALFFLKEVVVARAARFDYGTKVTVTVKEDTKDLGGRKVYTATDGKTRTRGAWERIVQRGRILKAEEMVSEALIHDVPLGEPLLTTYDILVCRDETLGRGNWVLDEYGDRYPGFDACCTIETDLTPLATSQKPRTNPTTGKQYYSFEYKVGIFFGGTALKACLIWDDRVSYAGGTERNLLGMGSSSGGRR